MTPEEGYELAKKQRPGVKIVMGPTDCRDEWMEPINYVDMRAIRGPGSWDDYYRIRDLGE